MRAVLDANVLVSAVISTSGPPREIVTAWVDGRLELIAKPRAAGRVARGVGAAAVSPLGQHRDR